MQSRWQLGVLMKIITIKPHANNEGRTGSGTLNEETEKFNMICSHHKSCGMH